MGGQNLDELGHVAGDSIEPMGCSRVEMNESLEVIGHGEW